MALPNVYDVHGCMYARVIEDRHIYTNAIEAHKRTVDYSIRLYSTWDQYSAIVHGYKRPPLCKDTLMRDFDRFNLCVPLPEATKTDPCYLRAIEIVTELFRPPKSARPVRFWDLANNYPFKWNTSAELPFTAEPIPSHLLTGEPSDYSFGHLKDVIFERCSKEVRDIIDGTANFRDLLYPNTIHMKSVLTPVGKPDKIRTICGLAKLHVFVEMQILYHYAAMLKSMSLKSPMLWGFETATGGMPRLWNHLNSTYPDHSVLCLDWKSFDKRISNELIDVAFDIQEKYISSELGWHSTIQSPPHEEPLTPEGLRNALTFRRRSIKEADMCCPNGEVKNTRYGGLRSGKFSTQISDSMITAVVTITTLLKMGYRENQFYALYQGDDSLITLEDNLREQKKHFFLGRFASIAATMFNFELSIDKSFVCENINNFEVLGYKCYYGTPWRDQFALLAALYHIKTPSTTPAKTKFAAAGYAFAAAGQEPAYSICRNIWDFYADVEADPRGASIVDSYDTRAYIAPTIGTSHFPSKQWITDKFNDPGSRNRNVRKYFDEDYFVDDYYYDV